MLRTRAMPYLRNCVDTGKCQKPTLLGGRASHNNDKAPAPGRRDALSIARSFIPFALVAALVLAAHPARSDIADLAEKAKAEGAITWYTAHTDGETAESVGNAFTQKYPGIKAVVIRTTAQVAYQRLMQEIKNNIVQCDVFSSTDVGHDIMLKQAKRFAHYVPENASKISPEFQNFDPDGYYYPTAAGLVLITYNTNKVKPEDAPKTWT